MHDSADGGAVSETEYHRGRPQSFRSTGDRPLPEYAPTIVIVGGVAGGATAAARARRMNEHAHIILLENGPTSPSPTAACPITSAARFPTAPRCSSPPGAPQAPQPRRAHPHEAVGHRPRRQVRQGPRPGMRTATYELALRPPHPRARRRPDRPADPGNGRGECLHPAQPDDTDRIKHYLDTAKPSRAVVVGAGFIGLEMVEQLADRGIQRHPRRADRPGAAAAGRGDGAPLPRGRSWPPTRSTCTSATASPVFRRRAIEPTAITLASGKAIATDLVILGIGVRPNTKLAEEAGLELRPEQGHQGQPLEPDQRPDPLRRRRRRGIRGRSGSATAPSPWPAQPTAPGAWPASTPQPAAAPR